MQAIDSALAFLATYQRPDGELPILSSRFASMAEARPHPCSVYVTAFVALALARLPANPTASVIRQQACAHLQAQRNPNDSWSYEGRATRRVPPDLDDTAVATAALVRNGASPGLGFFRLLWENESQPGGPYYTWVGVNGVDHLLARQIDGLVNANVLYSAAVCRMALPGTAAYLRAIITASSYEQASDYCFTPHLFAFCLARASSVSHELADTAPALRDYLLNGLLPAVANPFERACTLAALRYLGEVPAEQIALLLGEQLPDGSWPIAPSYSGYPPHFDGSPALTTAIAIEALLPGN
jgi:hypothetical protein